MRRGLLMNTNATPESAERYFEDYLPGTVVELGSARMDGQEMLQFARRFDPQPIHVDAVSAAAGPFGGLIASGWHTASLMMNLYATRYLSAASSVASPGIESIQWPYPVRAGDELRVRVTVLDARRSRSKADRGVLQSLIEVLNQDSRIVMSMRATNIVLCRTRPEI